MLRTAVIFVLFVASAFSVTAHDLSILPFSNGPGPASRQAGSAQRPKSHASSKASERKKVMEISFVKSGGLAGPMTRVQGTIRFKDNTAEVTGDASYHRQLTQDETALLRAGADPQTLTRAATSLSAQQSAGRGMGDVDHLTIKIKTADGKTH